MTETRKLEQLQGKQLSNKDAVKDLLDKNKHLIAQALPRHMTSERMLRCAITAYTTTPALKDCYVPSLIGGIVQCAIMGLEPNTPIGHAYLIPFNNKNKKRKEVQVIFGYPGLIDLMRRSGNMLSINAGVVRNGDLFEFEYGLDEKLKHIPAGTPASAVPGFITHFYAYAKLRDGGQQFIVMTKDEVDSIMHNSQSRGQYGPWKDHYVPMGKKTAIRQLSKYMPRSIELATALQMDERGDMQRGQSLETALTGEYTIEEEPNDSDIDEHAPDDPFDAGYGHKKDITGILWDHNLHAMNKDGHPVWVKNGQFRLARRKQEEQPEAREEATENYSSKDLNAGFNKTTESGME